MHCPNCNSENVYESRFQSRQHQMSCNECHHLGTYYEFGMHKKCNTGLITEVDDAVLYAEENFYDASDGRKVLAITIHEVNEKSACNVWIRLYDQWLKFLPERVLKSKPSVDMMRGELIRLAQERPRFLNDFRAGMVVYGLQGAIDSLDE